MTIPLHLGLVAVDTTISLNKDVIHTDALNNNPVDHLCCEMAFAIHSCKIKRDLHTITTWQVKGRRYLSRNLDARR